MDLPAAYLQTYDNGADLLQTTLVHTVRALAKRFMLEKILKVIGTALLWTGIGGGVGAAFGVVCWLMGTDSGHIPANKLWIFLGVPGAMFGFCVGLVYAVVIAILKSRIRDEK